MWTSRQGVRIRRPDTKRKCCAHCGRVRLAKFIEWHPGISEWQCSDFRGCDEVIKENRLREYAARELEKS